MNDPETTATPKTTADELAKIPGLRDMPVVWLDIRRVDEPDLRPGDPPLYALTPHVLPSYTPGHFGTGRRRSHPSDEAARLAKLHAAQDRADRLRSIYAWLIVVAFATALGGLVSYLVP